MKKIIIILSLTLLLSGCGFNNKKIKYYENISSIIIGFNKEVDFNEKSIDKDDLIVINQYKNNLVNMDKKINISNLVNKLDSYKTNEKNSKDIYIENGDCYINTKDVKFNYQGNIGPLENSQRLVCNGYIVQLLESNTKASYEEYIKTRKYGYRYLGYKETDNGFIFGYRSYYTGATSTIELYIKDNSLNKIVYKENQIIEFDE